MNFLKSLIFTGILFFAAVYFGSNYVVAQGFANWLGVPVRVDSVRWGISSHRLILKNVRIHNPEGYSDKNLARISRIQADYDASDLRHGVCKIERLEVVIEEIRLERKSISESNILELNPLRMALNQELKKSKQKNLPILFQINKVKVETGKVLFETQLGNDSVTESRKMVSPVNELTELTNPDRVAVYVAFLALQSAGWQALLPTQAQIATQIKTQVNDWVEQAKQQMLVLQNQIKTQVNNWTEQAKQQMRVLQNQINQVINEKLGKKV